MQKELDRAKFDSRTVNLKDAKENRSKGDEKIKTSCICCKFKPDCDEAIPFFSSAADMYHSSGMWNEEIYCREKLVFCFRTEKSAWEEGNELEKLAVIHLTNLNSSELAFQSITNAYNAFFSKAEYESAIKCLTKLGDEFREKDEFEYAERVLKIAYDGILTIFHVVVTKKEDPSEYIYKAIDQYLAILCKNDKVRVAIQICEDMIKTFDQYEEEKTRIVHLYGFLLLSLLINNDVDIFTQRIETAKNVCQKNSDIAFILGIEKLNVYLQECNEKKFNDCMIDISYEYPNELCKKLKNLYQIQTKKETPVVKLDDYR